MKTPIWFSVLAAVLTAAPAHAQFSFGGGAAAARQAKKVINKAVACTQAGTCGTAASTATASIPLGTPVAGVTLSGPLAGKTMYLLPLPVNPVSCWKDSVEWTGTELLYGISAIGYTQLVALTPSYAADPGCSLPSGHVGAPVFNVYSAVPANGTWQLTDLAFNTGAHPFSSPKVSGSTVVYSSYEKTSSLLSNLYLIQRTGANSWGTPVAFSRNGAITNDDNADIFANGTKMIFESNRLDPLAVSSAANHQQLWTSTFVSGAWTVPAPLVGAPALGAQSFQPWVDETTGNLYWTGDSAACGGGVMNCVQMAVPSGQNWSNAAQTIIAPSPLVAGATSGKVVLVGQYTQAKDAHGKLYAFAVCGVATEGGNGTAANLYLGRWSIYINVCVIPF